MKRNKKMTLTLIALAALTFGSSSAWARHHWNNGSGMGPQATASSPPISRPLPGSCITISMNKPAFCVSSFNQNATNTMRC